MSENDISHNELLRQVRAHIDTKIDGHGEQINRRIDGLTQVVEDRFKAGSSRMDTIEAHVTHVDAATEANGRKTEEINGKFDAFKTELLAAVAGLAESVNKNLGWRNAFSFLWKGALAVAGLIFVWLQTFGKGGSGG